jgi:glycosyltransferase involved in cell wall biosynthesis
MQKICIITTRHISYNPRVLKEADTLSAHGYEVSVVTVNSHLGQSSFDEELMRSRSWELYTVNFRKEVPAERRLWVRLSVKKKLFTLLSRLTGRFGIAERAMEKAFDELLRLAKARSADLYLAHHAEALGVGFRAARSPRPRPSSHTAHSRPALFGFDAEDFHTGMDESVGLNKKLVTVLEKRYLPRCSYLTAASKGIADAYADKYRIRKPVTILNVFPREPLTVATPGSPVKFYWYSQVIGPKRGLEVLLEAAGKVQAALRAVASATAASATAGNTPRALAPAPTIPSFEIHLRGSLHNEEYGVELKRLAEGAGCAGSLFLHPPILPEEIIADGNRFDIGLALESDISVNRDICVTNKVFSYLMSGLALVITDTYGQKDIFKSFPGAGRLCRKSDPEDLAAAMKYFIGNPERLMEAKQAAREAAESRFNWEVESGTLLDSISACLA